MSTAECRGGPLNGQRIVVSADRFEVSQPAQPIRVLERVMGAEKEITLTRGIYERAHRLSGDVYAYVWKGWLA